LLLSYTQTRKPFVLSPLFATLPSRTVRQRWAKWSTASVSSRPSVGREVTEVGTEGS
jgi:hypothetical protein